MALGKKHRVELDIKRYLHLVIGDKKVGKTSLVADLAREIYGSIDKLLIVSIGKEKAYEAIDGAIYEEPQNWQELMAIVDELANNIDKYDFDLVSFDTIDEIIPMAEAEVMRLHTVAYKEVPKSFNACFGGYGEPRKKLAELIDEMLLKLDTITHKTGVFFIGHNKIRPIRTKLDTEDYYVISSNLSFDYFNIFAYRCPIICNIIKEVDTVETGKTEGMGKQQKEILIAEKRDRFMYFRDSGAVEAGGRFKNMPEKVPYGARNYYDAVIEGIKSSIDPKLQDEVSKQIKTTPQKTSTKTPKRTLKTAIAEVIEKAQEVRDHGISQNDIMDVFRTVGYPNPNDIPDIEIADNIIKLLDTLLEG